MSLHDAADERPPHKTDKKPRLSQRPAPASGFCLTTSTSRVNQTRWSLFARTTNSVYPKLPKFSHLERHPSMYIIPRITNEEKNQKRKLQNGSSSFSLPKEQQRNVPCGHLKKSASLWHWPAPGPLALFPLLLVGLFAEEAKKSGSSSPQKDKKIKSGTEQDKGS